MIDPVFLELADVLACTTERWNAFGGLTGIRDEGLLLSALARPENRHAYAETMVSLAEGALDEAGFAVWPRGLAG